MIYKGEIYQQLHKMKHLERQKTIRSSREAEAKLNSYLKFEVLFEDINRRKQSAQYYHVVFLLRRIFFITMCTFSNDSYLQSATYIVCSMVASFYIAATSPFEELSKNRIEQFNEIIVFLCGLFQLVLSGITILPSSPNDDPTTRMVLMRSVLSYLILVAIAALLLINFGISFVEIVR